MRKKLISILAGVGIIAGILLCTSTFFMANGKIGLWVTDEGMFYPYDEALHHSGQEAFSGIQNLKVTSEDLAIVTEEVAGDKIIIKHEYLGNADEFITKKEGNTLYVEKKPGARKWSQWDLSFINGTEEMQPRITVGLPKGLILETVDITSDSYLNSDLIFNNIEITKALTINAYRSYVDITASKIATINLTGVNYASMQDVTIAQTFTTDSSSIDLTNVQMKNGAITAAYDGQITMRDVHATEELKIANDGSHVTLENVTAKNLDLGEFSGGLVLKDIIFTEDLQILEVYSFEATNTKFKTVEIQNVGYGGRLYLENVIFDGKLTVDGTNGYSDIELVKVQAKGLHMNEMQASVVIRESALGEVELLDGYELQLIDTNIEKTGNIKTIYDVSASNSKWANMQITSTNGAVLVEQGTSTNSEYTASSISFIGKLIADNTMNADDTIMIQLPADISLDQSIELTTEYGELVLFDKELSDQQRYEKVTNANTKLTLHAGGDITVSQDVA